MLGKTKLDYKKLSDEQLILEFQKEDVNAFNEIVLRYKDKMINFIFRFTGSREEAEDLAQDTFIKLYRSKHLYKREAAKFSTWLYTIASNTAKSSLRKNRSYSIVSINNSDSDEEKDFELPSNLNSPDAEANTSLEENYIQRAINSLEEIYREVIVLRDVQGLDYDEVAKITNLPLGTVKSRINRGREKLKIILEEFYKPKEK